MFIYIYGNIEVLTLENDKNSTDVSRGLNRRAGSVHCALYKPIYPGLPTHPPTAFISRRTVFYWWAWSLTLAVLAFIMAPMLGWLYVCYGRTLFNIIQIRRESRPIMRGHFCDYHILCINLSTPRLPGQSACIFW